MNETKAQALTDAALTAEYLYDFDKANKLYTRIVSDFPGTKQAETASQSLSRTTALIREKEIYRRIHRNAQKILTSVGMNIADSKRMMEILVSADAVDFKNRDAVFIVLKSDYVAQCLEMVPRAFPGDPGLNAFGIGPGLPFMEKQDKMTPRAATRAEFENIVAEAAAFPDVVRVFGRPVKTDDTLSDFDCARMMDYAFSGLKMIATAGMTDRDAWSFRGREDWLDRVSLLSSLTPVQDAADAFIRSAETRNNLLLSDVSVGDVSAPFGPEAMLTLIHAQVLFMMVFAQTINPGIVCIHGGATEIPVDGKHPYPVQSSSFHPFSDQWRINAALARLNLWITGFPSAQCCSCSGIRHGEKGEGVVENSRDTARSFGGHIVLQSFGISGQPKYFSIEQFVHDCMEERRIAKISLHSPKPEIPALEFPADKNAFEAVRETVSTAQRINSN